MVVEIPAEVILLVLLIVDGPSGCLQLVLISSCSQVYFHRDGVGEEEGRIESHTLIALPLQNPDHLKLLTAPRLVKSVKLEGPRTEQSEINNTTGTIKVGLESTNL